MSKTAILIGLVCVAVVLLAYHFHTKECMSAGLGTTTGLSFYNNARQCFPGNSTGSSSPYCTTVGTVLF
jgi:hypothetical protein